MPKNKHLPTIKSNLGTTMAPSSDKFDPANILTQVAKQRLQLKNVVLKVSDDRKSGEGAFQFVNQNGAKRFFPVKFDRQTKGHSTSKLAMTARALGLNVDPLKLLSLAPGQHIISTTGIKHTVK